MLFIDINENLPIDRAQLLPIDGLVAGDGLNCAMLLTHYHGDHIGIMWTGYIGERAKIKSWLTSSRRIIIT